MGNFFVGFGANLDPKEQSYRRIKLDWVLVEQSPILIWRANTEALCDYFNERWLSFRGRTMDQEFGNGWADGVHPDDFDRCLKIFLDNFHQRNVFEMEYRLMRYDGVYRWIFDRGVPFSDANGVFTGYIGSCIDVTDRVEAQEALRQNLEREIKTLKGVIPICSYCNKIRNDKESWQQLEAYITEHSDALFSHGICPTCLIDVNKSCDDLIHKEHEKDVHS